MSNREPLLSDAHRDENVPYRGPSAAASAFVWGVDFGRHFYEDKITKGELMVVKTVQIGVAIVFDDPVTNNHGDVIDYHAHMPCCGHTIVRTDLYDGWNFCPGCGSKILAP